MHDIEPYYNWLKYYHSSEDENSPFFGKKYNYEVYSEVIYNHYIDPAWDYMGSDTLYVKVLFADYQQQFAIIELLGEWNDALYNDIMHLKRNLIDHMTFHGISKFILIGENVLNFHGSDDCYYEEWFEELETGWIAAIGFRDFIFEEWKKYNIDYYINFGGNLQIENWKTFNPVSLYVLVSKIISHRIDLV